jgi:hypothetical protein
MLKGHLDQTRANSNSTKRLPPSILIPSDYPAAAAAFAIAATSPTTGADAAASTIDSTTLDDTTDSHPVQDSTLLPGQRTHSIFAAIHEATGQIYTDQPGCFLVASSSGNSYILILYDYDNNFIHDQAMPNRTAASIVKAYTKAITTLTTAGLRPQLQRLDNEASTLLQQFMKQQDIDFQLVPPHLHRCTAATLPNAPSGHSRITLSPDSAAPTPPFHSTLGSCSSILLILTMTPPPPAELCGYGAPHRVEFTWPSLHLKSDCPPVCWQLSHDKGSYGGNHDRFMKFVYKLPSDATTELVLLLNFLCTQQFQATGLHHGLVPAIGGIHSLVDLTKSPSVDATFMSNPDRPEWSNHSFWTNAHRELGFSLHRVLAIVSRDSAALAPVFARIVSKLCSPERTTSLTFSSCPWHACALLRYGHLQEDCARSQRNYSRVRTPRFTLWLQRLCPYREFTRYQDSEVTMWFIDGLLAHHQLLLYCCSIYLVPYVSRQNLQHTSPCIQFGPYLV